MSSAVLADVEIDDPISGTDQIALSNFSAATGATRVHFASILARTSDRWACRINIVKSFIATRVPTPIVR
jgi:hypothetical protein